MAKKQAKLKTIGDTYAALQAELESMGEHVSKFDGGTQAAGSRVRKSAQAIKVLCQQIRGEVTEIKNARKG